MENLSNRDLLIRTASTLFRQKGYSGVGLREILAAAQLPKGTLYYHFPGGKRELGEAATCWAETIVRKLIESSFANVADFSEGAAATCQAVARLSEREGRFDGCPVVSILQAGAQEPELRALGQKVLAGWINLVSQQARRLGDKKPYETAMLFVMQLQGAWILALAEQNAAPFNLLECSMRQN